MNMEIDCINCQLQQIIRTIKIAEESGRMEIMSDALNLLSEFAKQKNVPAAVSTYMQKYICKRLKCKDPYYHIKEKSNIIANNLLSEIKKERTAFSIEDLCLLSAAGNLIDFAVIDSLDDCKSRIMKIFSNGFFINDICKLDKFLRQKKSVLYFTDNSGEIVFDKILIEYIKNHYAIKVYVVINANPILNDATREEIIELGFEEFIDGIIEKNPEFLGFNLDGCHNYFRNYFTEDSFIISKGMANYECFSTYDINIPIIEILLAKCHVIANRLEVPINAPVVKLL